MKVLTGDGKTVYLPGPGHVDWFADDNVPEGYLACDGSAVSRETYADLFAKIGTAFGTGNGSTTFNVPDMRGKFVRGYLSGTSGAFGAAQAEGLPNITGNAICAYMSYGVDGAFSRTESNRQAISPGTSYIFGDQLLNFSASRSNNIYGASSHVTPVNVALLPCIKY